ncbi:hypothetical protein HPB52_014445 [Rhipicephalus sanguineus]|uniref:Protein quiver n=1 Tax=Rhipicephalus sanguineus TaxID=34632 RepID=A0A9D4PCY7_RHISA|nr:hypothetical protein HPB52_014445 [Rhipicephalus sanguineus]
MAACWFAPRSLSVACLLVVLAPRVALAFTCSVCNSAYNEDCMTSPEKYIKECVPPPMFNDSDHPPFCRKSSLFVYKPDIPHRVYRACAYLKDTHDEPCRSFYPPGMYLEVCQCFAEGCNAAPPSPHLVAGDVWWWAAVAFALALFR